MGKKAKTKTLSDRIEDIRKAVARALPDARETSDGDRRVSYPKTWLRLQKFDLLLHEMQVELFMEEPVPYEPTAAGAEGSNGETDSEPPEPRTNSPEDIGFGARA